MHRHKGARRRKNRHKHTLDCDEHCRRTQIPVHAQTTQIHTRRHDTDAHRCTDTHAAHRHTKHIRRHTTIVQKCTKTQEGQYHCTRSITVCPPQCHLQRMRLCQQRVSLSPWRPQKGEPTMTVASANRNTHIQRQSDNRNTHIQRQVDRQTDAQTHTDTQTWTGSSTQTRTVLAWRPRPCYNMGSRSQQQLWRAGTGVAGPALASLERIRRAETSGREGAAPPHVHSQALIPRLHKGADSVALQRPRKRSAPGSREHFLHVS